MRICSAMAPFLDPHAVKASLPALDAGKEALTALDEAGTSRSMAWTVAVRVFPGRAGFGVWDCGSAVVGDALKATMRVIDALMVAFRAFATRAHGQKQRK